MVHKSLHNWVFAIVVKSYFSGHFLWNLYTLGWVENNMLQRMSNPVKDIAQNTKENINEKFSVSIQFKGLKLIKQGEMN